MIGLAGAALAAYFLTQVEDINTFYFLRLTQGLFGAAPAVVLGALVRDLFERNRFAQMMSVIMIITLLAPLVAPVLGGYIAKYLHWHSIFYTLVAMGIACVVLVAWKIPETLVPEKRQPINFKQVLINYAKLLSHKPTLGYVIVGGLTFAGMFCFLTSGSLVYIGIYGVSQEHFGYFFMLNMVVMISMTAINGKLVTKLGSETMLRIGLITMLTAGIWLAIVATFELNFWLMVIGVPFYVGMLSTVGSNATAAVLDKFPQMAGTANAVAGTARFGIGSVVGALLSQIAVTSAKPMLYAMTLCVVLAAAIYYVCCVKPGKR